MKSRNPCISATVAEALERLPGPKDNGSRPFSNTGACSLRSTLRVGSIRNSRTREMRSTSSRQERVSTFAVTTDRRLGQLTFSSPQPEAFIVLKIFRVI